MSEFDWRMIARFWSSVDIGSKYQCWPWRGGVSSSYGQFAIDGRRDSVRRTTAHRVAYMIANGCDPGDLEVDHICSNRLCCNPDHLQAVTHEENIALSVKRRTHCKRGHEYTAENTYAWEAPYRDRTRIMRACRACRKLHDEKRRAKAEVSGA